MRIEIETASGWTAPDAKGERWATHTPTGRMRYGRLPWVRRDSIIGRAVRGAMLVWWRVRYGVVAK